MLVLSHRGHPGRPENTLDAFAAAVDLGADGIETDVRLSADGLPILFHDRVLRDGHAVASLTHAQLSATVGFHVPLLDEVLARWNRIVWNVEVKVPEAADAVADILARQKHRERFLVTSFWHNVVYDVARRVDVACGVLVDHHPATPDDALKLLPRHALIRTIVWDFEVVDAALLDVLRDGGIRSFAYGLRGPDEHRRAVGLGLAGVITDEPQLLRPHGAG